MPRTKRGLFTFPVLGTQRRSPSSAKLGQAPEYFGMEDPRRHQERPDLVLAIDEEDSRA
jgi:hypothetical protein